jgi:hypothetical protein
MDMSLYDDGMVVTCLRAREQKTNLDRGHQWQGNLSFSIAESERNHNDATPIEKKVRVKYGTSWIFAEQAQAISVASCTDLQYFMLLLAVSFPTCTFHVIERASPANYSEWR